jgi:hypothetical protein
MFIRQCYRRKNGKRHAYWALVESYRTCRGPRQRIVSYLGEMDVRGWLGIQQAAAGHGWQYQHSLFEEVAPQWFEVDTSRIRVERCVDFQVIVLQIIQIEKNCPKTANQSDKIQTIPNTSCAIGIKGNSGFTAINSEKMAFSGNKTTPSFLAQKWRRGDSNPRPETLRDKLLHV